jgi:hypothetical protein
VYRLSNLNALSLNDAARLLKNARAYLSFALMALSLSSGMTVTETVFRSRLKGRGVRCDAATPLSGTNSRFPSSRRCTSWLWYRDRRTMSAIKSPLRHRHLRRTDASRGP